MTHRIALVATATAPEPGALLAARLRRLREAGWDARLFCRGDQWSECAELCDHDLRGHVDLAPARDRQPPPRSRLRRPAGLLRRREPPGETSPFDQRLMGLHPHLIHFHSGHAGRKGIRLKAMLGCRVVVSFREDGQDLVPRPELLWQNADVLVFPDRRSLQRAVAQGCPSKRAAVLPGPALAELAANNGASPAEEPFRIVSAGPLTWEQGLEHSLHALRLVLEAGVDCRYRILGSGHHRLAVGFARHQLGLAEHVELVPRGDLEAEIGTADALVDSAVTDTTCSVPLHRAQAAGVPYVASARPGLCADAGIVVPRREPRAIAEALATLARDPALRVRMGEAGRRAFGGGPTLEEHLTGLLRLYSRALA